jgi:acetoacetyl-CoA synthase
VLGPVPEKRGLAAVSLQGYGSHHPLIGVPAGGSRLPASEQTVRDGSHFFRMDGRGVRDFVYANLPGAIDRLLLASGIDRSDVGHFIPHQANRQMLTEVWPKLGLPSARMHVTVDKFGNTGAASIPVTLDAAHRRGEIAEGEIVLMAGFGGGMNIGAALCSWTASPGLSRARAADHGVPSA